MFKAIDLLTESATPLKQAWDGLIRNIQNYVEHNRATNSSGTDMARGDIVYASDHGEVTLAIYDGMALEEPIAVCAMDIDDGDNGVVRTNGYALVHFEDGLTLVEGTPAYLSGSDAGQATDVDPGGGVRIGIIANATGYNGVPGVGYNPFAYVCLGYTCAPFSLVIP